MLHLNVSDSLAHGLGCKCRIIIRVWKRWERYYINEEVQMVFKKTEHYFMHSNNFNQEHWCFELTFCFDRCIVKHCWIHGLEVGFNWKCVVGWYAFLQDLLTYQPTTYFHCKKVSYKICSRINQLHIFNVRMFLTRFAGLQTICMFSM